MISLDILIYTLKEIPTLGIGDCSLMEPERENSVRAIPKCPSPVFLPIASRNVINDMPDRFQPRFCSCFYVTFLPATCFYNIKEGAITATMFANCALQIYLIFISLNISKKNKRHFFFTYPIFANFALLFTNLKDTDKRSKARNSSIPKDWPNR